MTLVSFDQAGHTDVLRDATLDLRFSQSVDSESLHEDTVRVVREKDDRAVPVHVSSDGSDITVSPPAPFGFAADTKYAVVIRGFPSLTAVRSSDGRPLDHSARFDFTTGQAYRPDPVPPAVGSIQLVTGANEDWSIDVRFTEAVSPSSVEPGVTLRVQILPSGDEIPGKVIAGRFARAFRFYPDSESPGGVIRVSLTGGVTGLSGAPLALGELTSKTFTLPRPSSSKALGEIAEDFSTSRMMDPAGTTALWNDVRFPGALVGEPASTTLFLPESDPSSKDSIELGPQTVRIRILLTQEELGVPRDLTGIVLEGAAGGLVPATYSGISVRLTPTLRTALDAQGSDVAAPTTVLDERELRITGPTEGGLQIPFDRTYSYDGRTNLVLEIRIGAGSHTNVLEAYPVSPSEAVVETSGRTLGERLFLGLESFSLVPTARSRFYDSGVADPVYLSPIIHPMSLPPGVTLTISYQGAHELGPDGGPLAGDPSSMSDWVRDVTALSGYRYVRFRMEFDGVSSNGAEPAVDDLIVPFRR